MGPRAPLAFLLMLALMSGAGSALADPCSTGTQPYPPPTGTPDMTYGDLRSGQSGDGRYAAYELSNGSYVYVDASTSYVGAGHHVQVGSGHVTGSYYQYGTVGPDIKTCVHTT